VTDGQLKSIKMYIQYLEQKQLTHSVIESLFDLLVKKSAIESTYWDYNQLKKKRSLLEKVAIVRYN
jgi:hypothetical protein